MTGPEERERGEPFTITAETRAFYIEMGVDFAINLARKFSRMTGLRQHRDDFEGVAQFKLIEVVDKLIRTGERLENKTHFFATLRTSIMRRLTDASGETGIIRLPRRRGKKVKTDPEAIMVPKWRLENMPSPEPVDLPVLLSRCRDYQDKMAVRMAVDGSTLRQVAEFLNVPQREIRQRMRRLIKAPRYDDDEN